ncbi:uncharacterized protein VTP21DRAFT_2513 [Calcarisporiella thermophila]|uniref:uncharacterized protein n=1 Tax=Calcarisporiella thermophila TaxID=911321 RepID=UPI0037425FE3
MGNKLRWSMWGRTVALAATFIQVVGSLLGIFDPSPTFGFWTRATNFLFFPVPILPLITLTTAIIILALELPLGPLYKLSHFHLPRAIGLTAVSMIAFLGVQTMNSSLYYFIAALAYTIAWWRDEAEDWGNLPR